MSVFAFSSKLLFSLIATDGLICNPMLSVMVFHIVDSLFVVGSGESVSSSICAPVSSTTNKKISL